MNKTALLASFRHEMKKDWGQAKFNSSLLVGLIFSIPFSTSASSRQVGVALPLLFLVVNFGESYLSVHATSLLFAVFSSFLYKVFNLCARVSSGATLHKAVCLSRKTRSA